MIRGANSCIRHMYCTITEMFALSIYIRMLCEREFHCCSCVASLTQDWIDAYIHVSLKSPLSSPSLLPFLLSSQGTSWRQWATKMTPSLPWCEQSLPLPCPVAALLGLQLKGAWLWRVGSATLRLHQTRRTSFLVLWYVQTYMCVCVSVHVTLSGHSGIKYVASRVCTLGSIYSYSVCLLSSSPHTHWWPPSLPHDRRKTWWAWSGVRVPPVVVAVKNPPSQGQRGPCVSLRLIAP